MPLLYSQSLGCAKNQCDSEKLLRRLAVSFDLTHNPAEADCILINTCAFIQAAVEETVEVILDAIDIKKRTGATLVVTGCFYERYREEQLDLPEVDIWLPIAEQEGVLRSLKVMMSLKEREEGASPSPYHYFSSPASQYVKIADGCSNHCSYCIIPQLRGPYRKRPMEDIVDDVNGKVNSGAKEIIFVAQDTLAYGLHEEELPLLLKKVSDMPGLKWVRLLYLLPRRVTPRFLRLFETYPKLCPYFEMPIQHCNDYLLHLMNRRYLKEDIENTVRLIRDMVPNASIRTTIITGFPGETEEIHQEMLEFIQRIQFDKLGVFPYSKERESDAARINLPAAAEDLVNQWTREILDCQDEIVREKNKSRIGTVLPVLFDYAEEGLLWGRTPTEAPEIDGGVICSGSASCVGSIYPVRITGQEYNNLTGEFLSDEMP